MTISRRVMTITVLLVGALMAISEAPEILTLTDNVTNDYVTVQSGQAIPARGTIKNTTHHVIPADVVFSVPFDVRDSLAHNFLRSASSKAPRSLLLLLVSQRR
jgi:hypothetical protein